MERDREIERELQQLGSRIQYPPTPDLTRTVRHRLEEEQRSPRRSRLLVWPPRWAAAAAVLVLVLAVPIFSYTARDTVSGWFIGGESAGGRGAQGESAGKASDGVTQYSDAAPPTPEDTGAPIASNGSGGPQPSSGGPQPASGSGSESTGGPLPSSGGGSGPDGGTESVGTNLGLGERISLRQAAERTGMPVLLPDLDVPFEIYAIGSVREDGVVLVYPAAGSGLPPLGETGAGLVLVELPGDLESTFLARAGNETSLEEVSVNGGRGYWAPDGLPSRAGVPALSQYGTLVWEVRGRALWLEVDLPKEEAARIARSVR